MTKKRREAKHNPRNKTVKIPMPHKEEVGLEILPQGFSKDESKAVGNFPWTLEVAEDALRKVDPGIDREQWRSVLSGLMTEFGKSDDTKRLAFRWSGGELHGGKQPSNYDPAENDRQWISLEAGHVSMGRLYQLAMKGGWDASIWRKKRIEDEGGILVGLDDSRTLANQVWNKLKEQELGHQRLFRYGREIARIDEEIDILTHDTLWQLLCTRLKFCRAAHKRYIFCDPPKDLIKFILNSPSAEIPLPELKGLTRAPVVAPDGSIHAEAGYSPISKLFHFPTVEVAAVPDTPTAGQVNDARKLLEEVIRDFPLVDASDRAHALSLMILPFVRPMIDGPTPVHFITKPVQGTGATLLGEVVTMIKTGKPLEAANAPSDDDEWKKTIIAKLLTLPEFFFLDNVTQIKSEALATALTTDVYEGRRLGVSQMVRVPVQCTWILTGNNPMMSPDFPRRMIHLRLDASMENPETGRQFLHPNLKGWVLEQRGRLIAAILTLCRAWIVADRPTPPVSMASFESWSRVIGGILSVAGIHGFLQTPDERKHVDDPLQETEREFVSAWLHHLLQDKTSYQKTKTRNLLRMAESNELGIGQGMRSSEHGKVTQLGQKLSRMRDKTYVLPAIDRLLTPNEPQVEVKVKVVRQGCDGDAWWVLAILEIKIIDPKTRAVTLKKPDDLSQISGNMFWSMIPILA